MNLQLKSLEDFSQVEYSDAEIDQVTERILITDSSVKRDWGTCECCGRTIKSEIYKGFCFNWYCDGEQVKDKCENYGKKKCPSCKIEQEEFKKKRDIFRRYIRETILQMLQHFCYVMIANNAEILLALLEEERVEIVPIKEDEEISLVILKERCDECHQCNHQEEG